MLCNWYRANIGLALTPSILFIPAMSLFTRSHKKANQHAAHPCEVHGPHCRLHRWLAATRSTVMVDAVRTVISLTH
ncbi:hypothetical protein BJY52DRAFT_1296918 [Lactarius psammicola]|nr:hypothetical protein BJY52DRAFT_1296918 [Lactarius psammicola]